VSEPTTETTQAHLRRAPRLPVFLVVGAVLGLVAALVLTAVGRVDPSVGFGATFGYLSLWLVPVGIAVGALVGIVIDQVSRRRARLVTVERASVEGDESDPVDDGAR